MNITEIANGASTIGVEQLIENTEGLLNNINLSPEQVLLALEDFEKAYKDFKNYKDISKIFKKYKANSTASFKMMYKQKEDEVYNKFFIFQNLFNNFYHRNIQMVSVININDERKLILLDNSIAALTREDFGSLTYKIEELGIQLKWEKEEYDASLLEQVTNEVFRRWDIALETHEQKTWLPIFWFTNGKWKGVKITNKGTLNEAYANLYINRFSNFTHNMESNVEIYILHPSLGAAAVDNTSGFAIGDVQYSNHTSVQFAIKGYGAAPMGLADVYKHIEILKKGIQNNQIKDIIDILPKKLKQSTIYQTKMLELDISTEIDNFKDMFKHFDN